MARAFIASVPLGVVLFAALVVPLAVTPGSFGFHDWPTARAEQVGEHSVRVAPRGLDVAIARQGSDESHHRTQASTRLAGRPHGTQRTPATGAAPAAERRSAELVQGPARTGDARHGSASGPGDPGSTMRPGTVPATPSTPASEGEPPAPVSPPQQVAQGDTPVLRDNEPHTPPTPASPIQPVAPPVRVVPSPPAPEQDEGDGDDGRNPRLGHGHWLISDIVHGIGNGRGRHLGFGHDGRD